MCPVRHPDAAVTLSVSPGAPTYHIIVGTNRVAPGGRLFPVARPAPEAVERLRQAHGLEETDAIGFVLRMLRSGNLSGDTRVYFVYCPSFGRLSAWLPSLLCRSTALLPQPLDGG